MSIGYPGVTADCEADVGFFVKKHLPKWLQESRRMNYIRQLNGRGGKLELNKNGWEELLRITNVKVVDGKVKLVKLRGM